MHGAMLKLCAFFEYLESLKVFDLGLSNSNLNLRSALRAWTLGSCSSNNLEVLIGTNNLYWDSWFLYIHLLLTF